MELGSREVEELLCARLGIAPGKVIALRGRLDHLRKLGCPTGVASGRGRPAVFGWAQTIQLAIAMDLIDLGVMPEHAASAIREHSESFAMASLRVCQLSGDVDAIVKAVEADRWPFQQTVLLTIAAGALSALQRDHKGNKVSLGLHEGGDFLTWFGEATPFEAHAIVINLGFVLGQLVRLVSVWAELDVAAVASDLVKWAEQHVDP